MARVEDQNRDFIRHQEGLGQSGLAATQGVEINPRFHDDMTRLDASFKVEAVASAAYTVFIIAGESIASELLDRYACGLLRDEIDRNGQGHPFKRAVIVSAGTWKHDEWFTKRCPAISIGGGNVNEISKGWLELARLKGSQPFALGAGNGVYLGDPRPRAVLSGTLAAYTKEAVERYIADPRGLKEFLENSWR